MPNINPLHLRRIQYLMRKMCWEVARHDMAKANSLMDAGEAALRDMVANAPIDKDALEAEAVADANERIADILGREVPS